jgi:hypothetical protein
MPAKAIGNRVTVIFAVALFVTPPYVYFPVTVIVLESWTGATVTTPEEEMESFVVLDMVHDLVPPVMDVPLVEYALRVHDTVSPGATDDEDSDMLTDPKVGVVVPPPPPPIVTTLVLVYPTSYWAKKVTVPALYALHSPA